MSIEIQKAQKAMAAELVAAEKRLQKAQKAAVDAQAALSLAKKAAEEAHEAETAVAKEFETLNSKYKQFLELFPLEEAEVKPVAAKPKAAKKKTDMTLIEKILSVMGDRTMSAGQIESELISRGLAPSGNNLRSYIHTLLGTQTFKVKDSAGNHLRDPGTGDLVRAPTFNKVERGMYCANKVDPIKLMAELTKQAEATSSNSEVLLVAPNQSPAAALFASQGLDVESLAPSTNTLS